MTFIVFDLDDTLCDTGHRQHILEGNFENDSEMWNSFFDACDRDEPVPAMINLFNSLTSMSHRVEIWTGRSDRVLEKTKAWLEKHTLFPNRYVLRMREEGDFRHDTEIKADWIREYGKPDLVFDDRNSVVKWWREQGVVCCQVKENDF